MKYLVLLFLFGFASASLYEVFEDAADEIHRDFMDDVEDVTFLKETLGLDDDYDFSDQAQNDTKNELGKKLRERLDQVLAKIKGILDQGKTVGKDLQKKLQDLQDKLKEMNIKIGNKAKELLDKITNKAKNILKDILGIFGLTEEHSFEEEDEELALADFNLREIFKKLKETLLSKIDKEKLKEKVEKIFGKGSEMADALLEIINAKGDKYKQKLLDLIDRYLGKEKRSIKDYWQKIKDYFKDLHIDLKDKYMKFGEWVKQVVNKGLDKSKSKIDNIKEIAREFIDHAKGVSKDIAEEALNFLRPYKDDLGGLYDQVKETVKDILNRKD